MAFVIDASSMVSVLLPDEDSPTALIELLQVDGQVFVPAHWIAEVVNALLSAYRARRIGRSELREYAAQVVEFDVTVEAASRVAMTTNILELAERHRLTTYDASYLELAARLEVPLATADASLRRAARTASVTLVE